MELKEEYKTLCETNNKKIRSGEKVTASCTIFINDEQKTYNFNLTEKNKRTIAAELKNRIIQYGAQGYIMVLDTITEKRNKDNNTIIKGECINRTLYTPTERISEYVWYSGTEILGTDRIEDRDNIYDYFDAWNEGDIIIERRKELNKMLKRFKN